MGKGVSTKKIALTGVMAAMVFAGSWALQIPMVSESRLHLGNIMCLLSGFLLGPVWGGLAAGIGSAAYDLTNPLYISTLPFTFIFKFLMAFVAGKISWKNGKKGNDFKTNLIAGICGIAVYMVLYIGRNVIVDVYFKQLEMELVVVNALQKLAISGINGVIAVVASVPLAKAVKAALGRSRIEIN